MADGSEFCAIGQGSASASIVCENDSASAALDRPRFMGGNVLRVFPQLPINAERSTLDSYAAILRLHLD